MEKAGRWVGLAGACMEKRKRVRQGGGGEKGLVGNISKLDIKFVGILVEIFITS